MCVLIKDGKDDKEEQKDENGLVEERFLINPGFALDKVKDKCDEMATLAQTNILQSIEFIKSYSHKKDEAIKANEKRLDDYEDQLETYLVKISDYGYNILKIKRKMHQEKIHFSEEANRELEIMGRAVAEIIENSTKAFINDDVELAMTVEPLEQVIDNLKAELRARHSKRMDQGECTFENGILFFDIVNSFERIADHCSNLAVCIIEFSQGHYQTHSYLKGVKNSNNKTFMEQFETYLNKYAVR